MHYADYKTILSPQNGMNLYRGCTHGCICCGSRSNGILHRPGDVFRDMGRVEADGRQMSMF